MKKLLLLLLLLISFAPSYAQKNITQSWSGTGFALKDKYVITNYHVVKDATTINICGIAGNNKKEYPAIIEAVDGYHDLALLRINDNEFKGFGALPYAIKTQIAEVGEEIFVLGYPLTYTMGEEIKLTNGLISSRTGFQGDISLYQISAPIQPGNSGAPLFDIRGNLIGVVSAKHKGAENVGYAIKAFYVNMLAESSVSASILPQNNSIKDIPLTEKVKILKDYIFIIKCSTGGANTHNASYSNNTHQNKPTNRSSQNCIFYTSTNGDVIKPKSDVFGAKIISNTYKNGQGIIEFDGPVTLIGENAFKDVEHLRSISIPSSVTWVGKNAFKGCNMLNKVDITDLAAWCRIDFRPIYDGSDRQNHVFNYNAKLFLNGTELNNIIIPTGITKIEKYSFAGFDNITSVTIPNSVTSIGEWAFYNCDNIASITIGNSVTEIGDAAFSDCDALESIVIPDSVTEIGNAAFSSCNALKNVTIGGNINNIGAYAFSDGCMNLTTIYCKSSTPPAIRKSNWYWNLASFQYNDNLTIYVPRNVYKSYTEMGPQDKYGATRYNWRSYKKYIKPYDFE